VGIAGPAKLQTLLKYAATCGVGPSVKVLQKRAGDLARLIRPFEPTDLLTELAAHKAEHYDCLIEAPHFFPLGGISKTAEWLHSRIGDR